MNIIARCLATLSLALAMAAAAGSAQADDFDVTFDKVFTPNNIGPGSVSTLTFTIQNTSEIEGVEELAFTDTLPANVTIADGSGSTTCANATLSAPSGTSTITFSDGQLGTASSCTVTVNVTSSTPGTHMNTSGDLTYTHFVGGIEEPGNAGSASDDLTVDSGLPAFSKSFAPDPIGLNGTSTLTFTIDNSINDSNVNNLDFTDTLPTGLQVASPANASTTCGDPLIPAVLTATPGSSTIILDSDGIEGFPAVASGATCTVTVDIKGTSAGTHTNVAELQVTIGFTTSSAGFASDALTVNGSPSSLLITKEFTDDPVGPGGTVTLDFTISNGNRDFPATGIAFTDNLAAFAPPLSTGAVYTSLLSNDCGGSVDGVGTTLIDFSGGSLPVEGSCSIRTSLTIPNDATGDAYTNTTSDVTGMINGVEVTGNTASNQLTVVDALPPLFSKSFTNDPVPAGTEATLVYTIQNPNASAGFTDIEFSELFRFVFNATLASSSNTCGATINDTVVPVVLSFNHLRVDVSGGSLSAGAACTVTLNINVPASTPDDSYLTESDELTADSGGTPVSGGTAIDTLFVSATSGENSAMKFSKEFVDDPVNAGASTTLRFTIENTGDTDVTDVTFTDDLEAMLTGAAASSLPAGVCGDGTLTGSSEITLSGATLSPGEMCVFDVIVDIPAATATGDYTNMTSDLSGTEQTAPTTPLTVEAASDVLSVNATNDAPVVLTKSFTNDPVLAGGSVTLEFTITNPNSVGDATDIEFTDNIGTPTEPGIGALPNLASSSGTPIDVCGAGSQITGTTVLTFTGGLLGPLEFCTFSVVLDVPADAADGGHVNTTSAVSATINGSLKSGEPAVDTLVVDSGALTFTKEFTDDPVKAGDTTTLLFTITNPLGSAVSDLAFTDELDDMLRGALFDSGVANDCGVMPTPGSSLIDISGGTVPANSSCTIEILVSVPVTSTPGTYDNTTSALTGAAGPSPVSAAPASDTLEVFPQFPPTFIKLFDDASPVLSGGSVQLTFTISNTDLDSPLDGLAFSDDLATMMLPGATFSGAPPNPCGGTLTVSGDTLLSFSGGTAPAGGDCSFDVTVNVPDAAPAPAGDFVNTTSNLTSNGLKQADPASDTLTVTPSADLAISITDSADPVVPGTAMTYTVDVDNLGPQDAANVVVTVTLPAEVTLVSTAGCAEDPNGVPTCSLDTIFSGGSASFTIDVNVNPDATSAFDTDVSVASVTLDPNAANDADTESTDVAPQADISVTKDDGVTEVSAGGTVTYTIEVTNAGPSDDPMVSVTDAFPAKLTACPFTSVAAGGATGNTDVAEDIGDTLSMPVGSTVTYTATCTVDVAASGDLENTADVAGSFDSNDLNDSATDTDTIIPAILDFSKAFAPDTISQGEETVLTFTIDNTGNAIEAAMLTFDDDLAPFGIVVADAPMIGNGCLGDFTAVAGTSTLDLADGMVAAGKFCEISVTLRAFDAGMHDNVTSALTSTLPEALPATDTLTVNAASAPLFSKAFLPDTIYQGEETVLTFTIDNTGNAIEAAMLTFDDDLAPFGIVVADAPMIGNGCLGDFTALAGTSTLDLADGMVAAGKFCEISVTLRAFDAGMHDNVTSALTSTLPEALPATDTLTVNQAGAPLFSKAFAPDTIDQGEETVLTFTIDNTGNAIEAAMLTFDDDLAPFGIVVADAPMIGNGCLGDFTALAGTSTLDLADGMVAAGKFCEISVTLRAFDAGIHDNVTSALTSSLPEALPATDTLTVNQAGAPLFSKAFAPDTIDQGEETVLTFTIDNTGNAIEAAMLTFDDDLAPFGIVVADAPMIGNGCLGDFTALAGTSTLDLADGMVAAGKFCEISVTLRALDAGIHDNVTSPLTSTLPEAPAAMATLTVTAAEAPQFSKAFAPDTIDQGTVTVLTFTIDNSANAIEASMLSFDDPLPPGVLVAASPNASNTCGGAFTAASGADTVDLADGTVAAGAVCELSVRVRAFEFGDRLNTTSLLGSSLGDAPAATATLTVNALPPAFSKTFTPDTIAVTGISRLVFLIDNSAASIPATGLDFTDVLPDDLVIAAVPKASSGCGGGTITAPAGGGTITYSGGTVNALDRCIVGVDVTSDVAGSYPNTSGDLTSSLGNSGTASATLTVEEAQVGTITILQFTDFDGIFTFTSDEPDLNFLVPTEDGFGSVGPITLPAGSYSVTQTRPTGVGNLEIFCSDDDSTGVRNTGVLTLNIDALEAVTCSFVSIKTDQITIDIINRFLALRIKLILANQPELGRRLERLARGFDSSSPVTFSNGDLGAMTPFTFNPLSLGSGQYRFSTSLAQVERAAASIALAHGDIAARRFVENRRFDAWVEMSYQKFDDNAANDGHFGIAFAGVDYLLTDDLLVGAVLQVDDMKDSDDASNSTVSGLGWMFGPYVTARVAPNLYFDARLAYGKSTNEISPFNTYTDTFTGERWLVSAGLVGEFKRGPWMIRPAANLSYFEETQAAYVDSLGAAIPSQTVALGQIQIGPTISGRFETANGVIYQPSLTLDGIYNFGETRGVTVTNPNAPETEGFRARVKAGVVFTNEMGTRIGISGIYDGIGQSDFESLGLSFELNIPLYKAKAR